MFARMVSVAYLVQFPLKLQMVSGLSYTVLEGKLQAMKSASDPVYRVSVFVISKCVDNQLVSSLRS